MTSFALLFFQSNAFVFLFNHLTVPLTVQGLIDKSCRLGLFSSDLLSHIAKQQFGAASQVKVGRTASTAREAQTARPYNSR